MEWIWQDLDFWTEVSRFQICFSLRENTFSVQTKYVQSATYETTFYTVFLGIFLHKSDFTNSLNLKLHRKFGRTSA